jgi:Protein of unknown function (DUF1569)
MKTLPDATAEILERLATVTPASPRQFGSMTPNQMICHLNDSYRLAMGERSASDASTVFHRTIFKFMALRMSTWPAGVKTRPEIDQLVSGTPPTQFAADKDELVRLIRRFCTRPRDFQFAPHPMFAELTEWEWMRWGYLHANHHLRQFGV